jgi:integrase
MRRVVLVAKPTPSKCHKVFAHTTAGQPGLAAHRTVSVGRPSGGTESTDTPGVPDSRKMHEMRHTALTTLLQATGTMKVVQLTAGHESMATTADIYSHYDLDDLRAAHSTLSAYLAERADA